MNLYLAGPDVFRPDAQSWATEVRDLCRDYGHQALVPLDGDRIAAAAIFRSNLRLIEQAEVVLANLTPFRGAEPDSGTCVEVGYALALGKRVVGYAESLCAVRERVQARYMDGCYRDERGWLVEDFALPFNLMLAVPLEMVRGGILECLRYLQSASSRAAVAY